MTKITTWILPMIFLVLVLSCEQFENHSNDGLYVGPTFSWLINGNDVKSYLGNAVFEGKIEHGDGYVKTVPTGLIMRVEYDSATGEKSLLTGSLLMEIRLRQITTRADLSELEILDLIANADIGQE